VETDFVGVKNENFVKALANEKTLAEKKHFILITKEAFLGHLILWQLGNSC